MITTSSGLQYIDTQEGTGETAQSGQYVTVHYTGWLYQNGEQGDDPMHALHLRPCDRVEE